MYRNRVRVLLALAAVGGCSTGNQNAKAGPPQVTSVVTANELYVQGVRYDLTQVTDKNVTQIPIVAPVDSVWKVLPGVFIELGVDPGTVDQQQHFIANTSFTARHRLGDANVSKYVDCGSSMSGKTADQATVTMSLVVQVVPDSGDISKLRAQFDGFATMDGAVANRIQCTSTGVLEARIARMVNDELAHRTKK